MRRSQLPAVALVTLVALLPACSAGEPEAGPKVATLTSAGPSAVAASAPAQRPRERLDTTDEEFEAMLAPYHKCLKDKGYDSTDAKEAAVAAMDGDAAKAVTGAEAERMDETFRACEAQFYPLPPWEKDPANPEARDFAVAVVACLKDRGVEFVEVADDGISLSLGGDRNDSRSITKGMDLAPDCEREVAAATK